MKKAIFTLVLLAVTTIAVAHPGSVLNLSVYGNSFFTVQLDQQFYGNPDRYYSIRSVTPGRHFLRVYRQIYAQFGMQQRQIFAGYIDIPAHSEMNTVVDRFGRLRITSVQPVFAENNYNDPYQDQCDPNDYGYGQTNAQWNQHTNYYPQVPVMSAAEFNQLKSTISSKAFDDTRLQIAKQALTYNHLTSAQVAQLLTVFTFESTKLDFAKTAFSKTLDKQNYHLTYSAFTFESSIDELIRYTSTIS